MIGVVEKVEEKAIEKSKDRSIYLDWLRIVATFCVIVLHVSATHFNNFDFNKFEWHIVNIYDGCTRWVVPIFVMISGAIFLKPDRKFDLKNMYKKKILRLCTSFLFWSFFYLLTTKYVLGYCALPLDYKIENYICGYYHLWFIYMIIGLYIITPVFREITKKKTIMEYFLKLSFAFTFVIPYIISIIKSFELNYISGIIEGVLSKINFKLTIGYSSYYVLGYYLSQKELSKKQQNIIYCLGILGSIFTVAFTRFFTIKNQKLNGLFYDYFSIGALFQAAAIFTFGKYVISKIRISQRAENRVLAISKYTFGIYLIHVFFMELLQQKGIDAMLFNPIISVPVISMLIFILSLLVSYILNHTPFLKKYIV